MKGFPKVIKTKSDLVNTFRMAKEGKLKKADWLAAVEKLENQNWITCPVVTLSEDRKTVAIMYCAEVELGQKIKNGAAYPAIAGVKVEEVNKDTLNTKTAQETAESENKAALAAGQESTATYTVLTLSKAVVIGTTEIGVPAPFSFYDRLGITKEEVETMKGELKA